jgi:poly(3-hydroxyalkanoate) synthetase
MIVAAPIKPGFIWDLQPEVSVVRQALRRGLRVHLLKRLDPGPAEDDRGPGHHRARGASG